MTTPESAEKQPKRTLPWNEWWVFLQHLLGLIPGRKVPVFDTYKNTAGSLDGWTEGELTYLIDEGRRQLDRLYADVERIRTRAQFLFTTCVGFLVVIFAGRGTMLAAKGNAALALWAAAILLTGVGLLGAASVIVASKALGGIDTVKFTNTEQPRLRNLAVGYCNAMKPASNTVNTQITVFRDASWLVLLGIMLYGVAWLVATL